MDAGVAAGAASAAPSELGAGSVPPSPNAARRSHERLRQMFGDLSHVVANDEAEIVEPGGNPVSRASKQAFPAGS